MTTCMMSEPLKPKFQLLKLKLQCQKLEAEEIRDAKQKNSEQTRKMNRKLKYAQNKQMNVVNDEKKTCASRPIKDVPNKVTKKTGSAKSKQSTCLGGDENRKKTDSFHSQVELIATASSRDLRNKRVYVDETKRAANSVVTAKKRKADNSSDEVELENDLNQSILLRQSKQSKNRSMHS